MCTSATSAVLGRSALLGYSDSVRLRLPFPLVLLMAVIAVAGCRARAREYPLHGQITSITANRSELVVNHGDIPGFMPAMAMAYRVKDSSALAGLTPGDIIDATLVVPDQDLPYLTKITRTGHAEVPAAAPTPQVMDVLTPGDIVPNDPLRDQNGATRHLADWKDKAVAVTFIYTRCPMPDFCPLMDRKFAAVQGAIKNDPSLRGVHLLSVSFDPAHDTPAVLAAHARAVGADPKVWTFLAVPDDSAASTHFLSRFGVSIASDAPAPTITHNLQTAVIDRQGRLVTIYSGSDWQPDALINDLRNAGR